MRVIIFIGLKFLELCKVAGVYIKYIFKHGWKILPMIIIIGFMGWHAHVMNSKIHGIPAFIYALVWCGLLTGVMFANIGIIMEWEEVKDFIKDNWRKAGEIEKRFKK